MIQTSVFIKTEDTVDQNGIHEPTHLSSSPEPVTALYIFVEHVVQISFICDFISYISFTVIKDHEQNNS